MSDEKWVSADPKTRPIPWERFVYGPSGAIRRPLHSVGSEDAQLLIEDHYRPITSNHASRLAPTERMAPPTIKAIASAGFRTWSKEAILLPEDWEPGSDVPAHPIRIAKVEADQKTREEWAERIRTDKEINRRRAEASKALEAHLNQQWEDSEYALVSFQDDIFNQAHVGHFKQAPRAKNWVARAWSDQASPGSLGREFLERVPGNYPAVMVNRIQVGDYLEVAADEVSHGGWKRADRLYFRVLWETHSKGRAAILHRLPGKPPLKLEEPTLEAEMERMRLWIETRGESRKHLKKFLETECAG